MKKDKHKCNECELNKNKNQFHFSELEKEYSICNECFNIHIDV